MYKKILSSMILVAVVVCSCETPKKDDIILEIGRYKLTSADLVSKRKSEKYNSLAAQELENKLVEEGKILAFAYEHEYDTISDLNKLLDYASRTYAARVEGFVWNKRVKPKLQVAENEVKDAYSKRLQEYVLEVIQFPDRILLDKYYTKVTDFKLLKQQVSTDSTIKVFNITTRFPYHPLSVHMDGLHRASVGDIVGPFKTEEGYLVAGLATIITAKQRTYAQEKESIEKELLLSLRQKYIWENQKRILDKAAPEIQEEAISEFVSKKIDAKQKSWLAIDSGVLLMTYNFEGERKSFYISDFNEFIVNTPVFFGSLAESKDIKKLLHTYIIDEDLVAEAIQMGMQTDSAYLQFRKTYQEMLFLEHYKRHYIYPRMSVTLEEMEAYYRNYNSRFKAFEVAAIKVYAYKTMRQAMQGRSLLLSEKGNARAPLIDAPVVREIRAKDLDNPPQLMKSILRLNVGQVSYPIEVNGQFLLVLLSSKKGQAVLPYIYVREEIKQLLQAQKEKQLHTQLAEEFQARYPVKSNRVQEFLVQLNE